MAKNKSVILILVIMFAGGAYLLFSQSRTVESTATTPTVETDANMSPEPSEGHEVDPSKPNSVVEWVMIQQDKNPGEWMPIDGGGLSQIIDKTYEEFRVVASGEDEKKEKFVSLIQMMSRDEPPSEVAESTYFVCHLAIFTKVQNSWVLEKFQPNIYRSEHGGGTRWAQPCDFKIAWQAAKPVLTREYKEGPFAGGVYSEGVQTIEQTGDQYELKTKILKEAPLEE